MTDSEQVRCSCDSNNSNSNNQISIAPYASYRGAEINKEQIALSFAICRHFRLWNDENNLKKL